MAPFAPTPSQPSDVSDRDLIECNTSVSSALVEAAHLALDAARAALTPFEVKAQRARARRRAALESRRITEMAAASCGLAYSAMTRLAIARYENAAEIAGTEVRETIVAAQPACASLDAAYADLRAARERHIAALLIAAQALEAEKLRTAATVERRLAAISEVKRLEAAQISDDRTRDAQRTCADDSHFDPRYDAREIAERRARPWV